MPLQQSPSVADLLRFGSFALSHPRLARLMYQVRRQHLTYLGYRALLDLTRAVHQVEKQRVPGLLLEAGCALGGSAILIAAAKSTQRLLNVYDTFGVIPEPTPADGEKASWHYSNIQSGQAQGIQGDLYYGYRANLLQQVYQSFESHHLQPEQHQITLVPGLFQDTLTLDSPVALAHLDCDWYESVLTCLQRIEPRLSPGGILVIDDYNDWPGCRQAVDEYFAGRRGDYRFIHKSRLHIQRR